MKLKRGVGIWGGGGGKHACKCSTASLIWSTLLVGVALMS